MQTPENLHDAAMGCLLGACVGDAAGATLEFIGHRPTATEVEWAMSMPGGGVLGVAPGQITDDGELTLCLARGLAGKKAFSIESIAIQYHWWVVSHPFDIGRTTQNSLGSTQRVNPSEMDGYAAVMEKAAFQTCMHSKANGSLMRATPLGIWGRRLGDGELACYAQSDSKLSHPNLSCQHAEACYVIAIASLMRNLGGREEAFLRAKQWAEANAVQEVCEWLNDAEENVDVPYGPQIGFVKIAFTHAFRHLLLGSSYVEAISETLAGGGDTDTNACVVGGLIGAACGARAIPGNMREAVLHCDTSKGRPRPSFVSTAQIPDLVDALLNPGAQPGP